ncbi:spore germination protein GerPB [Brevibacillus ginsengisoli]|uniref:spore germination protein GerPB n=1 Tax=Brevibacillus ginsengisoli TaxID=363854 RepID=UPI003CFAF79F
MNFFVQQTITIHTLRIEGITNSSVCQIGSAGIIKPLSNLFNTGCFTEAAPPAGEPPTETERPTPPLVPLVGPGR